MIVQAGNGVWEGPGRENALPVPGTETDSWVGCCGRGEVWPGRGLLVM